MGLLLLAAAIGWSILTDPAVAGDFDSGMHTAHTGGVGVLAFLFAVVGAATALAAIWRGPLLARLTACGLLLLAVPLVPVCGFVAMLSLNS